MNIRFMPRRWHRWHENILEYHCPTCHQIAGQPCTMTVPLARDFHLTRADMARRARKAHQ